MLASKAMKRLLVLTAFLSVAVVGLTVALAVSIQHNRQSAESPISPASATSTGPASGSVEKAPETPGIGRPAAFDMGRGVTGTATINSIRREATLPNTYTPKPKSGAYVVIDVTVLASTGVVPVNPLLWRVTDASGYVYETALGAHYGQPLLGTSAQPGMQIRGTVAFDVPAGPLTVTLTDPIGRVEQHWQVKT